MGRVAHRQLAEKPAAPLSAPIAVGRHSAVPVELATVRQHTNLANCTASTRFAAMRQSRLVNRANTPILLGTAPLRYEHGDG